MRTTTTLASLAFLSTYAAAQWIGGEVINPTVSQQDYAFLQFVSTYNKDTKDAATFIKKKNRFCKSDEIIQQHNLKTKQTLGDDPDALVLGHNWTSDLEPEEYQQLLGLNVPANAGHIQDNGRMLVDDRYDSQGRRL